jgi:hypothetical protein
MLPCAVAGSRNMNDKVAPKPNSLAPVAVRPLGPDMMAFPKCSFLRFIASADFSSYPVLGCRRAGANLWMAYGAGDPPSLLLVTAVRRPIQSRWLQLPSP